MTTRAALPGTLITLQDNATTGNGLILGIPQGVHYHIFYVTATAGVTSGVITFETSDDPDYAGTWAALPESTDPATTQDNPLTVAVAKLIYTYIGELANVRARISTTIAGGATPGVTVKYRGSH